MKQLTISKPLHESETVYSHKYPKYYTKHFDGEYWVGGPIIQCVKRWSKGRYTYYRLQYQEFEILRVFWVKSLGEDLTGKPLDRGYSRLASDW